MLFIAYSENSWSKYVSFFTIAPVTLPTITNYSSNNANKFISTFCTTFCHVLVDFKPSDKTKTDWTRLNGHQLSRKKNLRSHWIMTVVINFLIYEKKNFQFQKRGAKKWKVLSVRRKPLLSQKTLEISKGLFSPVDPQLVTSVIVQCSKESIYVQHIIKRPVF